MDLFAFDSSLVRQSLYEHARVSHPYDDQGNTVGVVEGMIMCMMMAGHHSDWAHIENIIANQQPQKWNMNKSVSWIDTHVCLHTHTSMHDIYVYRLEHLVVHALPLDQQHIVGTLQTNGC